MNSNQKIGFCRLFGLAMALAQKPSAFIIIAMNFDGPSLLLSLKSLLDYKEHLRLAHIGNALSLLKVALPPASWIGLYLFDEKEGNLILGPFQGTPACEEISVGKGVVGECFKKNESILVKDVHTYPNYICCDEAASSEICVPLRKNGRVIGVFDIDYPKGYSLEDELPFYEEAAKVFEALL